MKLFEILKKYNHLSVVPFNKTKLIGRDNEIQLLHESFYKKRMKNAVLVGNAGVGKTAIVEDFARLVKDKYYVIEFNVADSLFKTKYRGEFEDKIVNSLKDIIKHNEDKENIRKIILFIDEIHTIYEAGASEGGLNLGNILKPYLSRGEITLIGATTENEYNNTIRKDSALVRRLTPIYIAELGKENVMKIMESFCKKKVKKEFLEEIYQYSIEFADYSNPDLCIEILDRCLARKECSGQDIDSQMIYDIVNWLRIGRWF